MDTEDKDCCTTECYLSLTPGYTGKIDIFGDVMNKIVRETLNGEEICIKRNRFGKPRLTGDQILSFFVTQSKIKR